MTQQELYTLLQQTTLPIAYYSFKANGITNIPNPPYIVYLFLNSDNMGADNKVYAGFSNYRVELYSDQKDMATEEVLEGLFYENEIYWEKSETWIETESLFQVSYSIQI